MDSFPMSGDTISQSQQEALELKGSLDLLFELREEFTQWAGEAEDGSKREAFDNVVVHIEALQSEYRRRLDELQQKQASA
jgi:hypothetical protein